MDNLHIDSVLKSYGHNQILTDIFLSVEKGEIIGLLGRNGSGKSTLLKLVFGSIVADRKFVKVGDKRINNLAESINVISYLPQHHFLPNHIKIKTIVDLMCNEKQKNIILSNELIKPHINKKSNQLSVGERRFLEIMLCAFSKSTFSLIDEPFNGLAPKYKEEVKDIIKSQIKEKGFIVTDHDYRNIMDIATRIIILYDGGIKKIEKTEDLIYWGYIPDNM